MPRFLRFSAAIALIAACGPGDQTTTASDTGTTDATTAGSDDPTTSSTDATTEDETTAGTTVAPTTTTETTDQTTDETTDTTGPEPTLECVSTPGDHAADCPEPCAITLDVELRCDDSEFAAPGLRVAPSPQATYLVTSSSNSWYLFEATGDEASALPGLPGEFTRETILLATDPEGRVHLAADESKPVRFEGGATFVHQLDGGWKSELIHDNDVLTPIADLEFGQDGVAYAWVESDPPNGFSRVTRAGDGTWTPVVADTIGDDWHRFTLDADGVPVTFGYADLPPWQLRSLREGVAASLGQPSDTWFPERYLPTRSPAFGLEVVTPRYGAALQYPDSLAVAWPEGDAYTHVELPGTGAPQYTCVVPDGPPCEGLTCQESGVGVEEDQFALARTEDGAFWVAYVVTHYDQTYSFYEDCADYECFCIPKLEVDQSTAALMLARLSPELIDPKPLVTLTTAPIATWDLFIGRNDTVRAIDLRAHGSELALGVRLVDGDPYGAMVRLLRIDAAQL